MSDAKENPIEIEIRRLRAEKERDEVQLRKDWVQALSILAGILIFFASVVAVLYAWTDSDLTDALQECGRIVLIPEKGVPADNRSVGNESVDACRRMVFEYYGRAK